MHACAHQPRAPSRSRPSRTACGSMQPLLPALRRCCCWPWLRQQALTPAAGRAGRRCPARRQPRAACRCIAAQTGPRPQAPACMPADAAALLSLSWGLQQAAGRCAATTWRGTCAHAHLRPQRAQQRLARLKTAVFGAQHGVNGGEEGVLVALANQVLQRGPPCIRHAGRGCPLAE